MIVSDYLFQLLNVVAGMMLGSFFNYMSKREGVAIYSGEHVASILLLGLGFAVIPLTRATGLELLVLYITIICIGFSAIYDMHHQAIYPVTGVTLIIAVIRTFTTTEMCLIVGIYAVFLIAIRLLRNKLGEGDFEIAMLILVSSGIWVMIQSVFIASFFGLISALSYWLVNRYCGNKLLLKNIRVPFVPFLYLGYITAMSFLI